MAEGTTPLEDFENRIYALEKKLAPSAEEIRLDVLITRLARIEGIQKIKDEYNDKLGGAITRLVKLEK